MKLALTLLFVLLAAWTPVRCGKGGKAHEPPQPQDPEETRSAFAALDDVRLLANGLLQLGQSLREFVQKTKGQINDILQKLNIFDRSFYQLSVLASEIKEEEEELKKTTVVLKANNEEIRSLSLEISHKVDSILQERGQLQSKVGGLEEKLSGLSLVMVPAEQLAEIHTLKEVIHTQERSITELLKAVREQSDQLNHQQSKINNLEEKLRYNSHVQETVDRPADFFSSVTPTLPAYLTSNSTSSSLDQDGLPSDCTEVFRRGERNNGVYPIKPNKSEPFMVYCDMSEGGATVIQRRKDGSVNFDQTWEMYENGFGDIHGEFWLGLRRIHALAAQGDSLLHIQLEDWKQGKRHIQYNLSLEGPESHYTIHLAHASGDLPDAMTNHSGMMFSTKDRDHDKDEGSNCAYDYTGGWWFDACGDTNLNGRYVHVRPKGRLERRRGIHWRPSHRASYSLMSTQISIIPTATSASETHSGNFL
ncbi:angiopoietin-related protein 3-like [Osmerus eperlanus]|uniref:angiopoietin-related protein 3-like n=1 Tax=Osmerus eperlanus TaxID=29151 RepID=UPI002E1429D5